ncbi:MAG TPA: 5'-3' exonuclease H3TH domain-containing protein [Acidimicrobiales bacterium]|nr:5'-3' exonuclease H3TH domain-containing protein [Acidimicrobiales bacterium]
MAERAPGIRVDLVDGTYELFRHHFGQPALRRSKPAPADGAQAAPGAGGGDPGPGPGPVSTRAGTRGVLGTVLTMLEQGSTHLAVATDHVIESFRNDMWPTYKSSVGVPEELTCQFGPLEDALRALGVPVFAMVELEADDAMASAASVADADPEVAQVRIWSPDKDLAQCVRGGRVVQVERRTQTVIDEPAVGAKYGVGPASIPDWLALVGDSSDGYPGLSGWGPKSASALLAHYGAIEAVPDDPRQWDDRVKHDLRGWLRLGVTLAEERRDALLFKRLATLVVDPSAVGAVADWEWRGPGEALGEVCERLGAEGMADRAARLADRRGR